MKSACAQQNKKLELSFAVNACRVVYVCLSYILTRMLSIITFWKQTPYLPTTFLVASTHSKSHSHMITARMSSILHRFKNTDIVCRLIACLWLSLRSVALGKCEWDTGTILWRMCMFLLITSISQGSVF